MNDLAQWIASTIEAHETKYTQRPEGWDWACACGEKGYAASWDMCCRFTRGHWANVIAAKLLEKPTYPVGVSVLMTAPGKGLLLGKRKNIQAAGLWSTPGGRIEKDEDMFQTAMREVQEETGAVVMRTDLRLLGFKEHHRFGEHYFMIYIQAMDCGDCLIANMEPDKCEGWEWIDINVALGFKNTECTEPVDILEKLLA